jgi:hypothetical protein
LLEIGDASMAFVLGHELGYMAEDDYWHSKTFMTLDGDSEKTFQIYQNVVLIRLFSFKLQTHGGL